MIALPLSLAASQQSVAHALGVESRLVLPAHLRGRAFSLRQIGFHRGLILQVVANDCVYIRQLQRRVLLDDLLSSRALPKSGHDCVKSNAGLSYADHAVGVRSQGVRRWCK